VREFPVVGIGTSAGGLEALEALFGALPAEPGMAFVVVMHQLPGHPSLLPEILGKITPMPVLDAADGVQVEVDHVYVSPPGCYLDILAGTLHRTAMPAATSPQLPIDHFLRSLAADQKERAVCIILSGAGADGLLGLRSIKEESGLAMVQQVHTALYAGMPTSAVATGLADYVLPIGELAKQLVAYARGPYLATLPSADSAMAASELLQQILAQLRAHTGHDFSGYKANTIRRRVERRMNMHQLKDLGQYLRHLRENPHELSVLFKELLISVTCFFRDLEACELLASSVLPALLKSRPDHYPLRVWVPGCATGEEVYSLAILLRECMETIKRPFAIQLFGTDLDQDAIDTARDGLYPDGIAVDVSPQRLERCFTHEDGAYRIRKDLREMAIFAVQNVIKDPPFTKLDLISCRNLLIYLNADLQKRLLPLFRYALKPGGLLFLGPSETIGGCTDLFDVVDKKWKIFRRKESPLVSHPTMEFTTEPRKQSMELRPPRLRARSRSPTSRPWSTASCSAASRRPASSSTTAATSSTSTAAPGCISSRPPGSRGSTSWTWRARVCSCSWPRRCARPRRRAARLCASRFASAPTATSRSST
jgi:two-component system CheB/CheR fusion protein